MKTRFKSILLAVLMSVVITTPTVVFLPGCAFFSKTDPGSEALVVNAERVAILSFTVVDTFLEWEHNNRTALPVNVTQVADTLRDDFPPAYNAFRAATRAYKQTRSPADRETMNITMSAVQKRSDMASGVLPAVEKQRAEAKAAVLTVPPEIKSNSLPK